MHELQSYMGPLGRGMGFWWTNAVRVTLNSVLHADQGCWHMAQRLGKICCKKPRALRVPKFAANLAAKVCGFCRFQGFGL